MIKCSSRCNKCQLNAGQAFLTLERLNFKRLLEMDNDHPTMLSQRWFNLYNAKMFLYNPREKIELFSI